VESATAPAVWVAAVALALASDAAPPQDGSGLAAAPESELEPEMAVSVSPREEPANRGVAHTVVVVAVRSTTSEQR